MQKRTTPPEHPPITHRERPSDERERETIEHLDASGRISGGVCSGLPQSSRHATSCGSLLDNPQGSRHAPLEESSLNSLQDFKHTPFKESSLDIPRDSRHATSCGSLLDNPQGSKHTFLKDSSLDIPQSSRHATSCGSFLDIPQDSRHAIFCGSLLDNPQGSRYASFYDSSLDIPQDSKHALLKESSLDIPQDFRHTSSEDSFSDIHRDFSHASSEDFSLGFSHDSICTYSADFSLDSLGVFSGSSQRSKRVDRNFSIYSRLSNIESSDIPVNTPEHSRGSSSGLPLHDSLISPDFFSFRGFSGGASALSFSSTFLHNIFSGFSSVFSASHEANKNTQNSREVSGSLERPAEFPQNSRRFNFFRWLFEDSSSENPVTLKVTVKPRCSPPDPVSFGVFSRVVYYLLSFTKQKREIRKLPKKYTRKESPFISSDIFLEDWSTEKQGNRVIGGFRCQFATSGCYLILIGSNRSTSRNIWRTYKEVYVGQSVGLARRVYQHFTGHGNGDVYADIKYGKRVFVKFFPCKKKDMNRLECRLIEIFNATHSYNRTIGGSKKYR